MKRRLLFLFAVFMIATSVGWGQALSKRFTVDINRTENDTGTDFKTLEAAVEAANKDNGVESIEITVKAGNYDLIRGTTDYEDQSGWYLPIVRNSLTIKGEDCVTITSNTSSTNGAWASQNLVTIFGDDVTLDNLTFICKTEVNKVIEVVGDNVTLRNIKCTPPDGENFAGSIYFNSLSTDVDKSLGTATLENIELTKGRIAFSGVKKGTVNMENVTIDYTGVKIEDTSVEGLQLYLPIGGVEENSELNISGENVIVKINAEKDCYQLDANTLNCLPDGTTVEMSSGIYDLKPGSTPYEGQSGWYLPITKNKLTIRGKGDVTITSKTFSTNGTWASQNLVTIFGDGVTLDNLTFICKTEVNKVIEVVGDNVTLRNIKCTPPDGENFAGSIYFNSPSTDTDKSLGTATLENIELTKGRITFSGVKKGTVNMKNVTIDYTGVKIKDTSVEGLQLYLPIGGVEENSELSISGEKVIVKINAEKDCYQLDANMINNLPNNTTINAAIGTYQLASPLELTKSVSIVGADSAQCIIEGTWIIEAGAAADVVLEKLTLTENEIKTAATATHMIDVKSNNVNLTLNHVLVNPIAPGNGDKRACLNLSQNTISSSEVTVANSTFLLTKNNIIGLLVIDAKCDFSMENSRIMSNQGVDNLSGLRGILSKAAEESSFVINNSLISVGNNYHYAIWVQRPKQTFEINDSQIYGWAAFYMQGAWYTPKGADEMTLTAKNSSFVGVGKEGSTNGFGVIVFEATDKSIVDLDNCTVKGTIVDNTKDYGFIPPFVFQVGGANSVTGGRVLKPCSDCQVRLKDCTVQNGAEATTPAMIHYGDNICVFDEDGDTTPDYTRLDGYMDHRNRVYVEGETKFLNQDNTASIVVQTTDTLRNAAATLPNALVYMNEEIHVPIAYHNDEVVASSMTYEDALSALNASGAMPADYILPNNVSIVCKDAVLVSGAESYAEAYAADHPDLYVKTLKQTSSAVMFSAVDKSADLVISKDTEWTTARTGRNVKIKNGATLTIKASMSLGTVTMEEGAQLKPATAESNVTAQSLCFAPELSGDTWKALGVPFTSLEVKDSNGASVSAPSAKAADNGIWFAGLENESTPIFEVKTDNFGAAGLWAANGDSYTISSKDKFEIKEDKEPTAPTEKGTFLMCANPNTYTFKLTQSAYVLSEDGTSFEQVSNPEIEPFQSFVLTDANTLNTLRSLRLGDNIVTGTQAIEPVEGYYVSTERGAIVIHTAEPVQVLIVEMSGRIAYKGMATDGQRVVVPTGIYAVNGQLVRVK